MTTLCAWCQPTPTGVTVSHGICPTCITKHFPDLADEPATPFAGRVVGNPSKARFLDSYVAADGCISKTTTKP
jgi:hypothetical protein